MALTGIRFIGLLLVTKLVAHYYQSRADQIVIIYFPSSCILMVLVRPKRPRLAYNDLSIALLEASSPVSVRCFGARLFLPTAAFGS